MFDAFKILAEKVNLPEIVQKIMANLLFIGADGNEL
jgi:hypothetical protein